MSLCTPKPKREHPYMLTLPVYLSELKAADSTVKLVNAFNQPQCIEALKSCDSVVKKALKKNSGNTGKSSKLEIEELLLWLLQIGEKLREISQKEGQELWQLNGDINRLKTSLSDSEKKLVSYKQENDRLKEEKLSLQREITDLQSRPQKVGGSNPSDPGGFGTFPEVGMLEKVAPLQSAAGVPLVIESNQSHKKKRRGDLVTQNQDLMRQVDYFKEQVRQLQGQNELQAKTISSLEHTLERTKQELLEYRRHKSPYETNQVIGNLSHTGGYVTGRQQRSDSRDLEIRELQRQQKDLLHQLSIAKDETRSANINITKLRDVHRKSQTDLSKELHRKENLQSRLDEAEREITCKEEELYNFKNELGQVYTTKNHLQEEFNAAKAKIKELQDELYKEKQDGWQLQTKLNKAEKVSIKQKAEDINVLKSENEQLYAENKQLKMQMDYQNADIHKLNQKLLHFTVLETEKDRISAEKEQLMQEHSKQKAANDELENGVKILRHERTQQSQRLQELQARVGVLETEVAKKKKELSRLKKERSKLYGSNDRLQLQANEEKARNIELQEELDKKRLTVSSLQHELRQKQRTMSEYQCKQNELQEQRIDAHQLQADLEKRQAENIQQAEKIKQLTHKSERQQESLAKSEHEVKIKEQEIMSLTKDVKKCVVSNNGFQAELNEKSAELQRLTQLVNKLHRDIQQKETIIEAQSNELEQNKLHRRNLHSVETKTHDWEQERQRLQQKLDWQIKVDEEKQQRLQEQLNTTEAMVTEHNSKIAHLKTEERKLAARNDILHTEANSEKRKTDRLQKKLDEMKDNALKLEQQLEEKQRLITKHERSQGTLGQLKSDLENQQMDHARKVDELQEELRKKNALTQSLREQLSDVRKQVKVKEDEIAIVHAKLNEKERKAERFQRELTEMKHSVQQLEHQLGDKQNVIIEHERNQRNFGRLKSDMENKQTDNSRQVEKLKEEISQKRKLMQKQQKQLSQFEDQEKRKENEVARLKADLRKHNANNNDLKTQLERNKAEVQQLHKQIEAMELKTQQFQRDLNQKDKVIGEQIQDIEQLKLKLNDFQAAKTQKQQNAKKIEMEAEQLKQELNIKNKEIEKLARDLRNLKANLDHMNQVLTQRNSELAELEKGKQQLQGLADKERADHDNIVRQYGNKKQEMQMEIKQLRQQIAERESLIQQLKDKSSYMESDGNKAKVQQLLNELQQQREQHIREITSKDQKIGELSKKLAAEMSTKLAADESNVENVSIKNRPMNIAEEYQLLCSNQWLDAKSTLDDLEEDLSDIIKLHLLSEVLMVSERECRQKFDTIIRHFELMLFNPIKCVFEDINTKLLPSKAKLPKSGNKLSKELNNMYGDMLRTAADSVDIGNLVKDILQSLNTSHKEFPIWAAAIQDQTVRLYVEDTARLCWKMVIQRPSMEFKHCNEWLGDKYLDLYWNSDSSPNAVVVQVYPMLYHGSSLMAKGKVLLKDPKKLQRDERNLIEKRS